MATAACLPIAADRAGACVRTIFFEGLDLTGVTLALEMRSNPEVPGPAAISLGMGATANAEGLRLVEVTTVGGVPVSRVAMRVNETTMKDAVKLPYAGEIGSASAVYYDLIGIFGQDKRRLAYGTFTALPTVYGMDAAPANRPQTYGSTTGADTTWTSARLTFTNDAVTVKVDGADLMGTEVAKAAASATRSEAAAGVATTAASDVNVVAVGADLRAAVSKVATVAGDLALGVTSRIAIVAADLAKGAAGLLASALPNAQRAEAAATATTARFDDAKQVLPQVGGAGVGFDFADANGRTWFGADPDTIRHPTIDELTRAAAAAQPGADEFGIAAPDGTLKWSIGDERIRHPEMRELRAAAGINGWEEVRVAGEIVGMPIFGASHSRGFLANLAISTAASAYALTFAGGVRPDDGADPFGPLKALVEQSKGDYGETIASGMAEMIAQLLAVDGINAATANQRPLFSTSGEPGTPIATLADEASSLAVRFKAAIANGQARAADLGRTYAPLCIPFPAGSTDIGNDVTGTAWKASARKLRRWAQAHANAVCGTVNRPLPMLIAQQTTHRWYGKSPIIALAQLELAREDAYMGLVCAGGILPTVSDNLHFTALGEKWLGAMMGYAAYWWFWRGVKIAPLVPAAQVQGSRVILRFPVRSGRKLALDTATVPLQPGWGITAVGANGADVAVSNPRLSGSDTVIVDTAAPLQPGSKVRLGWTGSAYNGLTNLHDDDPTIFDPNGLKLPIWQWVPICEVSL